ncbi:hypothetical protein GCM10023074_63880 [Microbispora amethystogenes]|uniref:Luciferase-like domain-containing protein n=1 Tax=Microbispora amethystogenes TaxID=1427754 RepID=A0ABQ4FK79_9ACTN|nr:hypothetical protein Mam01_53270 [Microbispora amethystogenes]
MAPLLPGPDGELERIPDVYRVTFEPLQTLSHLAALTSRITLGTNIVNPLFQLPVVLARRYATLDQFSDGRVIAGFGQGWIRRQPTRLLRSCTRTSPTSTPGQAGSTSPL